MGACPVKILEGRGVGAGGLLIGGDHQATGVGHMPAHLGETAVGGGEHRLDPLPLGIQRRAPGLLGDVLGLQRTELGGDLVPGLGAPVHAPRVGHEQHRTHHVIAQRLAVAVGEVRLRAQEALAVLLVGDEGDLRIVRAERGAGQGEPPGGRVEGVAHAVPPGAGVAGVVDLVEDHQGAVGLGAGAVQRRVHADLRVGDRDALEVGAVGTLGVGEVRVQGDADAGGGVSPLGLQMLRRSDHGDPADSALGEQSRGDLQREGGLAGAGGGDGQEVLGGTVPVELESLGLPGTELGDGAPGRALRVCDGQRFSRQPRRAGGDRSRRRGRGSYSQREPPYR